MCVLILLSASAVLYSTLMITAGIVAVVPLFLRLRSSVLAHAAIDRMIFECRFILLGPTALPLDNH